MRRIPSRYERGIAKISSITHRREAVSRVPELAWTGLGELTAHFFPTQFTDIGSL